MNDIDISIIAPIYVLNDELSKMTQQMMHDIKRAIKNKKIEFIIVDNASTHGIEEMKKSADVYIRNETNRGWGGGINEGMKVAKGKYFIFANNDITISTDTWPELLIQRFESNSKIGTVSINSKGGFGGSFFAIRKEIYDKIGSFDEKNFPLGHAQDCDYLYRLMYEGWDDNVLLIDGFHHYARRTYNQTEFKDKYLRHPNFSKSDFLTKWGFKEGEWERRGHNNWRRRIEENPTLDRFNELNNSMKTIISYDDLWEGNDQWEKFEKLHEEFPLLKITFFVITGKCSEEFLQKIKQPWTELVFHSYEHSGAWLHWSKEEAKKWLLKFANDKYGFVKGFKAPAYKWTENIINACNELDYWMCTSPSVNFNIWKDKKFNNSSVMPKKYWSTNVFAGLTKHANYTEFYDHTQNKEFDKNLELLRKHCRENNPIFKFISEEL